VPSILFDMFKVESVGRDQLLKGADFVSMRTALTIETRRMMGLAQFKKMRSPLLISSTQRAESLLMKGLFMPLCHRD